MSYFNQIKKAIGYMEEHMRETEIDVAMVCRHVGVSRWHFQRVFRSITGDSVGDYLKNRRLSLAAEDLVKSRTSIIQISMSYGYESQEAFTRAFRSYFGTTPARFRKQQDLKKFMHKIELDDNFLKHLKEKIVMEPKIEEQKELKLVGFSAPFVGVFDENSNSKKVIPALWQRLMQDFVKIPNKVDGSLYGVVKCGADELEDSLTYKAMVEVSGFEQIPEGMETFVFPKGKLAKFTHNGSPDGIDKTLQYILGTWLPQSKEKTRGGLELEIYPTDYDPSSLESSFEYCLAIH